MTDTKTIIKCFPKTSDTSYDVVAIKRGNFYVHGRVNRVVSGVPIYDDKMWSISTNTGLRVISVKGVRAAKRCADEITKFCTENKINVDGITDTCDTNKLDGKLKLLFDVCMDIHIRENL